MTALYAIITRDKPDTTPIRMTHLKDHLAHVETVLDRIAVAGPLRDEAGVISGSLLVVRADSAADARAFLEADPYYKLDIWADIEIRAFSAAVGNWTGDKL